MYEKMRSPEAREAHKLQVKIKQRAEFRKNNTGVA